jgi:hypothetical protein
MLFRGYVRYPVPDDLSDVDGLIVELPTRSRSTSDNTSLLNPNCRVGAMRLDPTEGECRHFWFAISLLAVAGSLAHKKRVAPSAGSVPTHSPQFVGLLVCVVLIMAASPIFPLCRSDP